jgi:hypothetical protein
MEAYGGWLGGKRCTNTGQKVQFQALHISQKGSQARCSSLGRINYLFRQVYIIAVESGRSNNNISISFEYFVNPSWGFVPLIKMSILGREIRNRTIF